MKRMNLIVSTPVSLFLFSLISLLFINTCSDEPGRDAARLDSTQALETIEQSSKPRRPDKSSTPTLPANANFKAHGRPPYYNISLELGSNSSGMVSPVCFQLRGGLQIVWHLDRRKSYPGVGDD